MSHGDYILNTRKAIVGFEHLLIDNGDALTSVQGGDSGHQGNR